MYYHEKNDSHRGICPFNFLNMRFVGWFWKNNNKSYPDVRGNGMPLDKKKKTDSYLWCTPVENFDLYYKRDLVSSYTHVRWTVKYYVSFYIGKKTMHVDFNTSWFKTSVRTKIVSNQTPRGLEYMVFLCHCDIFYK